MGSGKLDAYEAMVAPIAASPASIAFGVINRATFPLRRTFTISNLTARDITVRMEVERWVPDSRLQVRVNPSTFTLRAGAVSNPVELALEGSVSTPGSYEGIVRVRVDGLDRPFHIPYLYLSGDGVPFNVVPVRNMTFEGIAGRRIEGGLLCKVLDRYGVPVANLPLRWRVLYGGGELNQVLSRPDGTPATDLNGIAEATVVTLGNSLGPQAFEMEIPNSGLPPFQFTGIARVQPAIETGGVVNAASGQRGEGLAAGSVVSIHGRGLSEFTLQAKGPDYPISLGGISVSFDDLSRSVSLPGSVLAVRDDRVDVQIPWGLAGLSSIEAKVSINATYSSQAVRVPLSNVSPAFWQVEDPQTGQLFVDARDEAGERINAGNRARRGQVVRLYANGLGAVDSPQTTGQPAPAEGEVRITAGISVRIGDREISPEFAGLAPGRTGVYEIRLRLPADLVTGTQDLRVEVSGVSSPAVRLPIEN
jgi:uncharacterized protein (TIGR03437 family)